MTCLFAPHDANCTSIYLSAFPVLRFGTLRTTPTPDLHPAPRRERTRTSSPIPTSHVGAGCGSAKATASGTARRWRGGRRWDSRSRRIDPFVRVIALSDARREGSRSISDDAARDARRRVSGSWRCHGGAKRATRSPSRTRSPPCARSTRCRHEKTRFRHRRTTRRGRARLRGSCRGAGCAPHRRAGAACH